MKYHFQLRPVVNNNTGTLFGLSEERTEELANACKVAAVAMADGLLQGKKGKIDLMQGLLDLATCDEEAHYILFTVGQLIDGLDRIFKQRNDMIMGALEKIVMSHGLESALEED